MGNIVLSEDEPVRTRPRIVLVEEGPAPTRRPVLVASSDSELPILPMVVCDDEETLSVHRVDVSLRRNSPRAKKTRPVLGDVVADQFAKIAEQRANAFDQAMRTALYMIAFMRCEAETTELSELADTFFDHMCMTAKLDALSRTYATLLDLLGTSERELKQLELIFWMHITVCPDEESSIQTRESHVQSHGKRIAELFHREAAIIDTEHGRDVISARKIPVVRIPSKSSREIQRPSFSDHVIIYPKGQTYGENSFVRFPDDRNACQVELERADGSCVIVQLMEKGMYARMKREEDGWVYCPTLSDFRVLTTERFVGSTKQLVSCDQLAKLSPFEVTTQQLLDAWMTDAKLIPES